MARQTRQQRQQRRKQDGAAAAAAAGAGAGAGEPQGGFLERTRERQAPLRPTAAPKAEVGPRREGRRTGALQFIAESYAELRKVEWPGQRQVMQGTIVVLIACVIVGVFLYASDQAFSHFVEKVLLR